MPLKNSYKHKTTFFRKKRRDYHIKSLKNPFYFKINKSSIKRRFNGFLSAVIVIAVIYFLGYTNFFKIDEVRVNGGATITRNLVEEIAQDQQEQRYLLVFKQDKLPFFRTKSFVNKVKEQVFLEEIKIKKDWPKKLIVDIKERYSDYYLLNQGRIYTLDSSGNIISILDALPASTTLPVLNFDKRNLVIGDHVVDKQYLDDASFIYSYWQTNNIEPAVEYIEISDEWQKEINVYTKDNFSIYFTRENDLTSQINIYHDLYLEKIKDKTNINYVDLRVQGWVYYK